MIEELGLSEQLFTLDALHGQKTVELVMATGHHLLVPVKTHQPTLFQHLTETDPAQPPQDRYHTHEIGRHHRIEQCLTRTWSLPPDIGTEDGHARFCTLVEIQRHTDVFDTRKKDGVLRQEIDYSLSTATLSAADAAHTVRAPHWAPRKTSVSCWIDDATT